MNSEGIIELIGHVQKAHNKCDNLGPIVVHSRCLILLGVVIIFIIKNIYMFLTIFRPLKMLCLCSPDSSCLNKQNVVDIEIYCI